MPRRERGDNIKGAFSQTQIFTLPGPIPARTDTIVLDFGWMAREVRRRTVF
jgi:hypothetical protein